MSTLRRPARTRGMRTQRSNAARFARSVDPVPAAPAMYDPIFALTRRAAASSRSLKEENPTVRRPVTRLGSGRPTTLGGFEPVSAPERTGPPEVTLFRWTYLVFAWRACGV